jgi:hypothetical protein
MGNKVTIELSPELASKLNNQALDEQTTIEDVIVNLLSQLTDDQNKEETDPITPLLGTLRSDLNDIGENHDLYLGNNLAHEEDGQL